MRAGGNPASDNSQRSATPPRPPLAPPTPTPALIRSIRTAYTAVVHGQMRESRTRRPCRTLPGMRTKCDGISLPRRDRPDFVCDCLRGRGRIRGFVDCATDDDRVGPRSDCLAGVPSLRSHPGRQDESGSDDRAQRLDPFRTRRRRDDARGPCRNRDARDLLRMGGRELRPAGMAHLGDHEDLGAARGLDGRPNAVLPDESVRDDPGCAHFRDLVDNEPRRVRDFRGPEVGEEVSEPREVPKYVPPAGEEKRPPDLDRIDLPVDRFRNGDRRSRIDEVDGEDQSPVEAHRGPEEGLSEKGFRDLLKEAFFHGAKGVVAVCDLTRYSTLKELDDWVQGVFNVAGEVPVVFAVNKIDLKDEVMILYGDREIEQAARAFEAPYFYASAKTGENVETLFRRLGTMVLQREGIPVPP